jgi:hypothetical protein
MKFPRSGSSARLYLRRRKPVPAFAMVGRADRNAEFCPALRRSRCTRRHPAPLGGLRSSAHRDGTSCRRCAEQEYKAGGQRFPQNWLWRPMSAPWPRASPLPLPAARPLDRLSSGTGQCVLPRDRARGTPVHDRGNDPRRLVREIVPAVSAGLSGPDKQIDAICTAPARAKYLCSYLAIDRVPLTRA